MLVTGSDHFTCMCPGLLGNRDTAEHSRDFFEAFTIVQREYRGRGLVVLAGFFDTEMVMCL